MTKQESRPLRWKPWVAGAAGLLAAYTAAGFWLVPWLIKDQLPKLGRTELARQATIGEVRFNPYTLRLEAQDLRLAEADGAPLFAIGGLAVELQWRSLLRRAWSFAEIRITTPGVNLAITPDGKFNLAELLATLERRPQAAPADGGLPRLVIEHFALEQGKVELRDRRAGYSNSFFPINFALTHFSTLPNESDAYTFSAESARGGKLRWKGNMSMNPIRGSGELVLENASLPQLAVYLKPYTGATVTAGQLAATLPYRFSYDEGKFEASLAGARVTLNGLALAHENASPPLKLGAGEAGLQLQLSVEQAGEEDFKLRIADAAFSLSDLALTSGAQTPFRLARLGFTDGAVDLAARRAAFGRVYAEGGQLQLTRDRKGQLDMLALLSGLAAGGQPSAPAAAPAGAPWTAVARRVELSQFDAEVEDQGSGVKVHVQDFGVKLEDASSDLSKPVKFSAGLALREGGQLSAQGSVVPASGALETDVRLRQLALAPLQPLLDQYLKLKIAAGSVSAQGRLTAGAGGAKNPALRYVGGFDIAGLALKEDDGDLFLAWKSVGADKLTASMSPHRLDIPELRIVEPNAKLMIENDRSFNAARLLVQPASASANAEAAPVAPAAAADDPFPVRVRRVRFQNARLDFSDLSLRPQFAAKIYELNGMVNGLSSNRNARSQIELDGRVDEFGLARLRGELNPFAPSNNTDLGVVFRNVDLVPASPYAAKFAGYAIAEGKISLDLQYKVRNNQLEGANQIVIDKLTLGERVDSPDALKLPLELAIAILKDSEGRIDLGLPVSGDLSDPQFSYGALIWKAIGNVLTKIVTAPFRALGSLFGVSGEKLEAIEFDPGSDRLLPPEREKLKQVAQVLSKRAQLKLSVPGHYSETADGAALKARAVRAEIAKRAGIKLEAGEEPGPVSLRDRAVRGAMRDLYAERFGDAELDKEKKAAEAVAAAPAATDAKAEAAQQKLPAWQRLGKLIQGEPQVADASAFYRRLQERLEQNQPLAADALTRLGAQRASAVLAALQEAGVDPASMRAAAPENIGAEAGKPVPLKLGLAAK